jgi:hypothetical protein
MPSEAQRGVRWVLGARQKTRPPPPPRGEQLAHLKVRLLLLFRGFFAGGSPYPDTPLAWCGLLGLGVWSLQEASPEPLGRAWSGFGG